jgi:hypothetical protein
MWLTMIIGVQIAMKLRLSMLMAPTSRLSSHTQVSYTTTAPPPSSPPLSILTAPCSPAQLWTTITSTLCPARSRAIHLFQAHVFLSCNMALHTHSANFHGVLANESTIHGLAFLLSFSHPFWAVLGSTRISGDFLRHDLKQLSLMCIMLLFFCLPLLLLALVLAVLGCWTGMEIKVYAGDQLHC